MSKLIRRIKRFARKNPARIAAFVSSATAIVVGIVFPDLPVDEAVIFVLAALGLGEYAQRVENSKTDEALHTEVPDEFAQ